MSVWLNGGNPPGYGQLNAGNSPGYVVYQRIMTMFSI